MKYAVMAVAGVLMGVTAALGIGCEGQSKLNVVVEEGAQAPHANLPSVPTLPPPPYPVQYPDGAYSVYGVRHTASHNWSKQVTVRGWIVKVYVPYVPNTRPPRVCTERDRCDELKPHIFIADAQNEQDPEKQMMVTGYAGFQSDIDTARQAARSGHAPAPQPGAALGALAPPTTPIDFYEGAQITVTGNFTRRAANGHADSNGLIEYTRHVTNTPSPQDPAVARAHH
jgi:hypothetical protein